MKEVEIKPFDFNETGSGIVSASIQKQSGDSSELKVQIIKMVLLQKKVALLQLMVL